MELATKAKYLINDAYNTYYIWSRRIRDTGALAIESMENNSASKRYATHFMTVWLKNIDRIIRRAGIDCSQYHFIDVGCGKGIATLYVAEQFNFVSYSGFDFEPKLVDAARNNLLNCRIDKSIEIKFLTEDASECELEYKKWFIFMFNPFSSEIIEKFLSNNIAMLRQTESVLGYANSREIESFRRFLPRGIQEIEGYRCAVINF